MDYIRKLPVLMSVLSGIIVGTAGYTQKVPDKENIFKMLIVMVIFYITGYLLRNTLLDIIESIERKHEEERLEKAKAEQEKKKVAAETESDGDKGTVLDLKADDESGLEMSAEELNSLPVEDFIKNELH